MGSRSGSVRLLVLPIAAVAVLLLGGMPAVQARQGSGPANSFTAYRTGADGGEPSIGWDPLRDAAIYGADTFEKRLTWDDSVVPGRITVRDTTPPSSVTTFDPITFTDRGTGRTFSSQLALACSLFSFSDDAGQSWQPGQGCGVGTVLDHQTVGGGPFAAGAALQATTSYPDAVYYCAQNSYSGGCATSTDGGLTFGPVSPAYNTPANAADDPDPTIAAEGGACSALHGHLRVAVDGTAYLPIKGCGGTPTAGNLTNTEYFGGHPS
ncbi:MAG TPA: hypothetical protein VFK34_04280, partial [Marmoricola sp.]|nr:hypothetical protein [Marmoricola sp.]